MTGANCKMQNYYFRYIPASAVAGAGGALRHPKLRHIGGSGLALEPGTLGADLSHAAPSCGNTRCLTAVNGVSTSLFSSQVHMFFQDIVFVKHLY